MKPQFINQNITDIFLHSVNNIYFIETEDALERMIASQRATRFPARKLISASESSTDDDERNRDNNSTFKRQVIYKYLYF